MIVLLSFRKGRKASAFLPLLYHAASDFAREKFEKAGGKPPGKKKCRAARKKVERAGTM